MNRVTQVSALGEVQFVFTVRVDPGNLARVADRIRALSALASLPVVPHPAGGILRLEGPITPDRVKTLDMGAEGLSAEDFTKFFLEPQVLLRLLERRPWSVRRGFKLLGCSTALRGVSRADLERALGTASSCLLPNPFEAAS